MTTLTTGTFFLREGGWHATATGGTFALVLRVLDNQGRADASSPVRYEPYQVKWEGEAARAWWAKHRGELRAGSALLMELENPRSFSGVRGHPETQALVRNCTLLPPRNASAAQPARVAEGAAS